MNTIPLPTSFEVKDQSANRSVISLSPCYPGYGTTLGNALRRILLSSLQGAAIKAVQFNGVHHEFTTIEHVKEDIVGIILNLKQLRFKLQGEDDVQVKLKVKGEKSVTAGDIDANAQVEVVDPKQPIATITDKQGVLEMEMTIGVGRGYDPVEGREADKLPVGFIAVDSIFTPVRRVNFVTENVRVGQMTNFEKVTLDIETDGTVAPSLALQQAVSILVEHFNWLDQQVKGETGMTTPAKEDATQGVDEAAEKETEEESDQEKE